MNNLKEVIDSMQTAIATDTIDWTTTDDMAWVYGILLGWDKESYNDLADKFGWSESTIKRNKRYHRAIAEVMKEADKDE